MKITKKTSTKERAELSQKDIERILRMHMVEQFGSDWENSDYYMWQESVTPYLGQLEDELETKVSFILETEE